MQLDEITGAILDASIRIHREVGPGLLESLYVGTLAGELRRRGLRVERERLISFSFDGIVVENAFRADLLVEERVIVESSRSSASLLFIGSSCSPTCA